MATSTINQITKPYTNLAITNPNPDEIGSISAYAENGLVFVSVSFKPGLQNWAAIVTMVVSDKYLPRQKINGTPRFDSTSDARTMFCTLAPDGKISAYVNTPALNYTVTFTFVYPERVME